MHRRAATLISLTCMLFAGCRASTGASPAPSSAVNATAHIEPAAQAEADKRARGLVLLAAACWSGGEWADALGEQETMKQAGVEGRCRDLERQVWAGALDKTHYEQLRALEKDAVADVVAKIDETAKAAGVDGHKRDALVHLAVALADEQKELMLARRAGDRVKRDLDHEPEKLTADEVDAVGPLREHAKLEALLRFDAPDLAPDARALALLGALDRVELARGLPKHLKLYAVADEFQLLFGVTVPDVPQDATQKLVPGTWLAFLSDTAATAGYPVSATAKTPRERDALAWAGMLEGFHDKVKASADALTPTTDLNHVMTVTLHRLEAQYRAQQAAEATLHPAQPAQAGGR
jgi:hypothetical protein